MEPRIARSLYQALRHDRCVFLYSGAFHDEHSGRLIALGEAAIGAGDTRAQGRGRLAFIMVEAYQNILRHRTELPLNVQQGAGRSLFLMRCDDAGHQVVVAVNPVKKSDVAGLRATLQRLQGKAPAELKNLFLSGLQSTSDRPRRGAGLGLIEMARRSGSDLGYTLSGTGEEFELFTLAVRLGSEHAFEPVLTETAKLHATVVKQDLLLFHLGERPVPVQEAVLRMVEEDVGTGSARAGLRGRAYLAANGFLASAGGAGTRYLCALTRMDRHNSLTVGRVMDASGARGLEERIQRVNALDRSEQDQRYRAALKRAPNTQEGADLLDLARLSLDPLGSALFPVDGPYGDTLMLVRAVF